MRKNVDLFSPVASRIFESLFYVIVIFQIHQKAHDLIINLSVVKNNVEGVFDVAEDSAERADNVFTVACKDLIILSSSYILKSHNFRTIS